ncbi:MAG: hypothetical protein GX130_07470 [Candidatus Hydrogenedens sp.]|jgi:hypothetical protein|nr:hypothetical protein [Candidatus Hydrogenedens sp.]
MRCFECGTNNASYLQICRACGTRLVPHVSKASKRTEKKAYSNAEVTGNASYDRLFLTEEERRRESFPLAEWLKELDIRSKLPARLNLGRALQGLKGGMKKVSATVKEVLSLKDPALLHGTVIAVETPHLEDPDFDWYRFFTKLLWFILLIVSPFLVLLTVLSNAGAFSLLMLFGVLYLLHRFLGPGTLLSWLHLWMFLRPHGRSREREQVPVWFMRVRDSEEGAEFQVRMKGELSQGYLMPGDEASFWGRRNRGVVYASHAFSHRTESWIRFRGSTSWISFVITLVVFLVFFSGIYEMVTNLVAHVR